MAALREALTPRALSVRRTMFLDQLVGSFSQGADGNPTVAMMEAAFRDASIPWRYVNVEVSSVDLGDAVRGARAMGWRGANVSMPHKQAITGLLDGLDQAAGLIGAVNCIVRDGDRFVGTNTDGQGFVQSLRTVVEPAGCRVVVLGAGGAARAIAVELALAGCRHLTIVNRSLAAAADLAAVVTGVGVDAEAVAMADRFVVPSGTHVVVNATSVGLHDELAMPAVDLSAVDASTVVADVVFAPVRTRLLREASARGAVTLDGLGMLANQGAEAIRRWVGIEPNVALMRATLEQLMGATPD